MFPSTDSAETSRQDSELRHVHSAITVASAAFSGAELDKTEILAALAEQYGDDFAWLAGVWKSTSPETRAEIIALAMNAAVAR